MTKVEVSKEWCLDAAKREGDSEVGAGALAMDPTPGLAEVGASIEEIVDLLKRVDREDAVALLRQAMTVERSAGFMDGMKHMDGVTRKTLDAFSMPTAERK